MNRLTPALIVFSMLVYTACNRSTHSAAADGQGTSSNTSTTAGRADLPNPCSLVTQQEVDTAIGKGTAMTSVVNQRTGNPECHLKPATEGPIDEVLVVVHRVYQWDAMKQAMLPPSGDAKPVPGLGDDAFAGRAIGYNVRKGNKYVQVFGSVINKEAANEKATRYLAEKAASRL